MYQGPPIYAQGGPPVYQVANRERKRERERERQKEIERERESQSLHARSFWIMRFLLVLRFLGPGRS
jgi:hypothetical protein